jgi:hypothetical protein
MRKALLLLCFVSTLFSLQGQKNVIIHFVQKAGSEDFALGNVITSDAGYAYKPTRLQYYVSLPVVIHDGGQLAYPHTRYFLVNAAEDAYLDLGTMNVENIEGVVFSIGVDQARNHLDPAQYPAGHPLAPQNPSMHWGWVAGYRFLVMEGDAGNNFLYSFEIHSIGNELYQTLNLETGAEADGDNLVIHLQADYNKLLQDIDVSGGLTAHGNLGPAAKIMENIGAIVFSPLSPSSLSDRGFEGSFSIGPNPAIGGQAQASLYLPAGHAYRLTLADLTGRTLSSYDLGEGFSSLDIQSPGAGMYLVQLWQNGMPVRTNKWIATE